MHPCKAPRPDGIHDVFYQRFLHIVGEDVIAFINNILNGLPFSHHVNNTNIAFFES